MNNIDFADRAVPQNVEAEAAILGALLIDNEAIGETMMTLKESEFYKESHRLLYTAITELYDSEYKHGSNFKIDIVTLGEKLRREGSFDKVGGAAYILSLMESVSTSANIESHIKIIKQKDVLRRLINISSGIISDCYVQTEEINDILDTAETKILDIAQKQIKRDFQPMKDLVKLGLESIEKSLENKGEVSGLTSGYRDFDKLTTGLHPSDLIVLAARPSMGKTAFALNIAENVALMNDAKVAIFSLEMSSEQLVTRMLCSHAKVSGQKVRTGFLNDSEYQRLAYSSEEFIKNANIFIDDAPGLTILELKSKSRRLAANHGLDMIIIDYLQLINSSSRSDNRQQEISEISRSLKALARELRVPVIVLSQLNRDVESREGNKPRLSDLRESGAIEQDADIVIMLMRRDYYDKDDQPGTADVNIAKHRNGPVGEFKLAFNKDIARFHSISFENNDEAV